MSSSKTYDEYKNVKHELFNQIPIHWEVFKASHLFDNIGSGTTPKSDKQGYYENGEVSWLTTGDLNDNNLTSCDGKITRNALEEHSALKEYPEGSIAIAMYGATIGKTAILQFKTTTNQACCVFSASSKIYNKYFHYQLLALKPYILSLALGGGQPNINQEILRSLKITVPKQKEQLFIANFLDRETAKIDVLIAEQERLIELLQEKRQAVISHAVTKGLNPNVRMKDSGLGWLGEVPEHWEVAQLKYFSKSLPGFAFPSDRFVFDEDKCKLLRGINVGVSSIRWDDAVYWDRAPGDGLEQYELFPGDLVVGLDRPLIKDGLRVARITREDCPCMLLQRVAAVKGVKALSTDYLYYLLSSPFFVAHFEPETTGVSVPHISTAQIDSFVVPIPPPGEQDEIHQFLTNRLDELKRLLQETKRSCEILQERRSALISAAVTGQIDVRGFEPEEEVMS